VGLRRPIGASLALDPSTVTIGVIVIDVERLDFLDFGNQAFLEFISGMVLNIFDVKYKIEAIFSTG
jgi:hypothetical protein